MSRWFDPPQGVFYAAAICFGLSFWALRASSREIAAATQGIQAGRCGEVWWVPASCNGIVQLQLAGSQAVAQTIVTAIQHRDAMSAAKTNVQLDYLLILSYVASLGFFGATVAAMKGLQGITWVRWVRWVLLSVVLLQAAAGLLDGLENVGLFAMLQTYPVAPDVAERTFWFSAAKWALIDLGAGLPAVVWLVLIAPRLPSFVVLIVRRLLSLLGMANPPAGPGPMPA